MNLIGVARQVDQDLPEAARVAPDQGGDIRMDQEGELQPLVVRPHGQHVDHVLDGVAQVEVEDLQLELVRPRSWRSPGCR